MNSVQAVHHSVQARQSTKPLIFMPPSKLSKLSYYYFFYFLENLKIIKTKLKIKKKSQPPGKLGQLGRSHKNKGFPKKKLGPKQRKLGRKPAQ